MLAWFELQGHTVDAKPLAGGLGSIRKHMAEVSFTLQGKDAFVSPQENSSTGLPPPQSLGAGMHHFCTGIWFKDGKNGYTGVLLSQRARGGGGGQRVKLRP